MGDEIGTRIRELISDITGILVEHIDDLTPLDDSQPDGLSMDSLERLELRMMVEEEFSIEIPDSDLDEMTPTSRAMADYLARRFNP